MAVQMDMYTVSRRFCIGLLIVFALYYAGFGWLPTGFIENRVLKFSVNVYPLFGSFVADFLLLTLSSAFCTLPMLRNRRIEALFGALAIPLAASILLLYYTSSSAKILALLSIAACLPLYALYRSGALREIVTGAVLIIIVLEVLTVAAASTYFVYGSWSSTAWAIVMRERFFWSIAEWISIPLLILASLLWFYTTLFSNRIAVRVHAELLRFVDTLGLRDGKRVRVRGRIALFIALVLAWLSVLLPHLPSVNPLMEPVSVDTFYYMKFIKVAETEGVIPALVMFRRFARPLYLLLLYLATRIVSSVVFLDIVHPLLALSLLVIAVYRVAMKHIGEEGASIAAILTSLGHSVVTFVAGGFQANSLALPLALLLFALDETNIWKVFLLGLAVALIHPWTFTMFAVAFVLYIWRMRRAKARVVLRICVVLSVAFLISEVIDLGLSLASPAHAVATTLSRSLGLHFPRNVFRGVEFWTWGSQANALILIFASISIVPTPVSAILAVCAPLFLLSSSMIVHRLILNIPLELQASALLKEMRVEIVVAMLLAVIARGLVVLTGLTPLTGEIWRAILYMPRGT